MGIRDEEIKRLMSYAKGIGCNVKLVTPKSRRECDAIWENSVEGVTITIFTKPSDSKLETVLSLIHEISHQLSFIHDNDRIVPKYMDKALEDDSKKENREIVYRDEKAASKYWEDVYKNCGCKFPIHQLYIGRERDVWHYEVWYETGKFPTQAKSREKLKELRKKYKK